jgi:hypothetical protein
MNSLEVTAAHVKKLTDAHLRALIVRLCEAELRRCGLPTSAITAGGHQDAPDGGIDVRIRLEVASPGLDFIPRANTGFQSKASPMSPADIKAEMRPKGNLRPAIAELGAVKGGYVIVASQNAVTDSALQARVHAMMEALSDLPAGANMKVDFYDSDRLATWVRKYHGVALWIRDVIGEPLRGWRAYGAWAYGDRADSEFVLDQTARIYAGNREQPLSAADGIKAIRAALTGQGGIVRLVGLSGVGKTRLVQALFDSRVGDGALDASVVVYADQGAEPEPSAREMLHRLRIAGDRAIVVVDNCNPATHRALAQEVKEPGSKLSLITVEYDVVDDEPEDTDVFHLEPASSEVVEQILARLVPQVSGPNRSRIADFSGGNARVALAVAKTIGGNESIGVLNDAELFNRLFYQNQKPDAGLLRIAEVCSLVYSFDGDSETGVSAELPVLATLAGGTVADVYRAVGDLRERDLIQKRGKWRAVLPHAIANRLAKRALERIPQGTLVDSFIGHERLLKSFARRLSYLHDSDVAVAIVKRWLEVPNWLSDARQLNELGVSIFMNVAPVCPSEVLRVMETAATGDGAVEFLRSDSVRRQRWVWLLRALAYEPSMFDRAAWLLVRLCAANAQQKVDGNARTSFEELFHVVLSGTKADAGQRLALIRRLLGEADVNLQELGLTAVDAMLRTGSFSSGHDFSFGARPRDFGWHPKTTKDLSAWYQEALKLVQELWADESPHRLRARSMVARHFRGLWVNADVSSELSALAKELAATSGGWGEGWIAIRKTLKFGAKQLSAESQKKLRLLESELHPRDLEQKLEAYVLTEAHGHLDVADLDAKDDTGEAMVAAWQVADKVAETAGRQFAAAPELLGKWLPRLLVKNGGRTGAFGRGLAAHTDEPEKTWREIYDEFERLDPNIRNLSLMEGYIAALTNRDPKLAGLLLDEAVTDPVLESYFPLLQGAMTIDDEGVTRLSSSIARGKAKAWTYAQLRSGRALDGISSATFKKLVLEVAQLPDGFAAGIELLAQRLHNIKTDSGSVDDETLALGRELLASCTFGDQDDSLDHHVGELMRVCFVGPAAEPNTRRFCENFADALAGEGPAWRYDHVAKALFELQPETALEVFFRKTDKRGRPALFRMTMMEGDDNPLNRVSEDVLLSWANKDVGTRFPWIAGEIRLFDKPADGQSELRWSKIARHLLEHTIDRKAVLNAFGWHLEPHSWSGSLADVLAPYLRPIRELLNHADAAVREWARAQESRLLRRIEKERASDRRTYQSFE